jgi:hypothetical protein
MEARMKYASIFILAGLAVVIVATDHLTAQPGAKPRNKTTSIFMTKNHNVGKGPGQYPAECRGAVATETIPTLKGDNISWKIKNGNGHDDGDRCPGLDPNQVALVFKTNVMGDRKILTGKGNSIDGTVSSGAARGAHGYHVMYKSLDAGPDPEILVDCPTCGPDGEK